MERFRLDLAATFLSGSSAVPAAERTTLGICWSSMVMKSYSRAMASAVWCSSPQLRSEMRCHVKGGEKMYRVGVDVQRKGPD